MAESLGSRYILDEPLGRGAMGQVFAGSVRTTGEPVAVKVLRPELVSDPDVVARFVQERTILMSIANRNVVRVIDLVIEGDTLAIVMELVQGSDLRRLLRSQGTLPPLAALQLTGQILRGMAGVHAAGIIHRDIKPENVLVDTSSGQPLLKLTDFGVSRLSYGSSLTKLSGVIGTPEYMAPELAEHSRATPAADIYSAGIVLYEALCGRTPFAGGHPLAVLRRQVDQPPPVIPGVPPELWDQIAWMLEKDPRNRPATAEQAQASLARLETSLASFPALAPWAGPEEAGADLAGAGGADAWTSSLTPHGAGRLSTQSRGGTSAGATVLRHRDHGDTAPPADLGSPGPWPGGDSGWRPAQPRPASTPQRRKGLIAALTAAAVVVLGLVATAAIAATHHSSEMTPAAAEGTTTVTAGGSANPAAPAAAVHSGAGSTGTAAAGGAAGPGSAGSSGSTVSAGNTSGSKTSSGSKTVTNTGTKTTSTGSVPGQVAGVTPKTGDGAVTLSWTAASGTPTGYQVSVSPAPASGSATQVLGVTTSDQVTGLTNGTKYSFTVLATNAKGNGPKSAAVTAIPVGPPPVMAAPSVEALPIGATGAGSQTSGSQTTLEVNVQASSSNGSPVSGYTVYEYKAASSGGPWSEVGSTPAPVISSSMVLHSGEVLFTVPNDGSWYYFTSTETNGAGTSAQSAGSAAIHVAAATTT